MAIKAKRSVTRILRSSSSCSMPGVWRAVTYCKGVAVVFHSPKACAHVARTMDIGSHFRAQARNGAELSRENVPLVSSMLSEQHSIFGGEKQLKKCLEHTIKTYNPQCVVIANSCVSGVIGDDIVCVAQQAEIDFGIPVVPVNCSGFLDGEYFEGYYETAKAFVDRFMHKQAVEQDSIFLIGDHGGPQGDYAKEVSRLLKYFDMEIKGQFPTYTNFEDLNKVPSAALNIVLGGRKHAEKSVEQLAVLLHERFDTPYYMECYPLGWLNTVKWLRGLGDMLGKQEQAALAIAREKEKRSKLLSSLVAKTKGKKVVLCIGRRVDYFQPFWVLEMIEMLEFDFLGVVLLDCYVQKDRDDMLREIRKRSSIYVYDETDAANIVKNSDLLLTTHEINNAELRQLYLPMLPGVGVMGELELVRKIAGLLSRRGNRGGIVYG